MIDRSRVYFILSALFLSCFLQQMSFASDHADTELLKTIERSDARITDFYTFTRNNNLVLVLCTNPAIIGMETTYEFSSDLIFKIYIDNNSEVSFGNFGDDEFGGTVVDPQKINEDVVFAIHFDEQGNSILKTRGLAKDTPINFFTGLRDDPFIRTPRDGKNVAAIVIELPLSSVIKDQSTILTWATAEIQDLGGHFHELAGRALYDQFIEDLNYYHPRHHTRLLEGGRPSVSIFNTASQPASFPNGRELTDDVLDLLGLPLSGEDPNNTANDKAFLSTFPYLAEPHLP